MGKFSQKSPIRNTNHTVINNFNFQSIFLLDKTQVSYGQCANSQIPPPPPSSSLYIYNKPFPPTTFVLSPFIFLLSKPPKSSIVMSLLHLISLPPSLPYPLKNFNLFSPLCSLPIYLLHLSRVAIAFNLINEVFFTNFYGCFCNFQWTQCNQPKIFFGNLKI